MDKEISFSIENDALVRNDVTPQDADNTYLVVKTPVFTKDVFIECFKRWIQSEEIKNDE